MVSDELVKLPVNIHPFSQPVVREKVVVASPDKLIAREGVLEAVIEIPQLQITQEVRLFVRELRVPLVGGLLLLAAIGVRVAAGTTMPYHSITLARSL